MSVESLLQGIKVDRSDLEERVYLELRKGIMTRELPPGTILTLRQVAEGLQVSATPVRGAVRRLQSDGLVQDRGKQGVMVIGLGAKEISDLFGVRLALETYAARRAVLPASDEAPLEMRRIVSEFPETFEGNRYTDYDRFHQLDNAFHLCLITAADNDRLHKTYQALNVHLHLARIYQREVEQRALANHEEHLAIVSAFEQREPDGMAIAVERHIVNVCDHILSKLQPRGVI